MSDKEPCIESPCSLTWIDENGRVTHDASGWPPQWGFYCYRCEVSFDLDMKPAEVPGWKR